MAAATVAGPPNSVARRQSISKENHINRIRSANSKRVAKILSSTELRNYPLIIGLGEDLDENEETLQERASETAVNNSRTSHEYCTIPTESLEELNKNKSNQSLEGIRPMAKKERKSSVSANVGTSVKESTVASRDVGEKRRKSSASLNTGMTRKQTTEFKQNRRNETNKSQKTSGVKSLNKEHPEKTPKSFILPKLSSSRRQSTVGRDPVGEKRRKSSVKPNTDMTRKQTTEFKQNMQNETKKSRKTSGVKTLNKEHPEKTQKEISRKSSVKTHKTPLNEKAKTQSEKRRLSTSTINEGMQKDFNPFDSSSSESDSDELIEISKKENLSSKDSHYSKDAVIFKWLHEKLNCPLGAEEEIAPNSSKSERNPICVLKKPMKTTTDKNADEFPGETEHSHVQNESKSRIRKKEQRSMETDSKELNDNYSETQKRESGPTEEITTYIHNAEMHVSELGKLQIILDPKILSQEDAAIIIWIDDIPESVFVPKYRRRLSLASIPDLQTSGSLTKAISSESATELEDTASKKPDIYFPSVTILKNIAVDSKHGLRTLSEEDEKDVYYKRCNIGHAEWELKEK